VQPASDSGGPPGLAEFNTNVTRLCNAQDITNGQRNTLCILACRAYTGSGLQRGALAG
jgi:hypothetical protein